MKPTWAILLVTFSITAQIKEPATRPVLTAPPAAVDGRAESRDAPPRMLTHTARIVLEDGSPPFNPTVEVVGSGCRVDVSRGGTIMFRLPADYLDCFVRIMMPGFRSESLSLTDGRLITLKRLGEHEGSSISITVLSAPPNAKREYEKGAASMQQRKWSEAEKHFRIATKLYPKYALAWSELGTALEAQYRLEDAAQAYREAFAADRKYIKPYNQLAGLEVRRSRWQQALDISAAAFGLNPIEFPGIYYFHAMASFNLEKLEDSEASVRRAIDLDARHEYPRSYVLFATVLARKGDRKGAQEALRRYLAIYPNASDAAKIKEWIARL